jgi:hypothetical protein
MLDDVVVETTGPESVKYVYIHSGYVNKNQVKLRIFQSDKDDLSVHRYVVFIIFHVEKDVYTSNTVINDLESFQKTILIKKICLLKRDQFESIEYFKTHFKVIHLDQCVHVGQMLQQPLPPPQPLLFHEQHTILSEEHQENAYHIEGYHPFSLDHHMNQHFEDVKLQTSGDFINYVFLVSDCTLLKSLNKGDKKKVTAKSIDYYNRKSKETPPIDHSQLLIDFLAQFIRFVLHQRRSILPSQAATAVLFSDNITYLSVESIYQVLPLVKEVINTEVFQFSHTRMDEAFIDTFHGIVCTHIQRCLSDISDLTYLSPWLEYYYGGADDMQVWERVENTGVYKVRYEWLLMIEKKPTGGHHTKILNGFAYIEPKMMRHVVLPLIYRSILHDVVLYICYMNRYREYEYDFNRLYANSSQWFIPDIAQPLTQFCSTTTVSNDALFRFSLQYGNHSSPVMRKWMKTVASSSDIATDADANTMYGRFPRDYQCRLPDIEDIKVAPPLKTFGVTTGRIDVLPPCMRKVMNLPHLKHLDRLNMVKYFFSMGYSEDDITRILDEKVSAMQVKILYKECMQHYASKEFSIMKCGSVINLTNPTGNVLKCHFVVGAGDNGPRTTRYDYDEKLQCIGQCFKTKNPSGHATPVDYVMQNLY